MELISVIVPVYNVEKYLSRCIDSILEQSYKNIEIILVDDGSTDGSGELCDNYRLKDPRVLVIHKSNGGLSTARNCGIDYAKGKYLAFIDSDDWIDREYLYSLYSEVNDSTIVCCGYNRIYYDKYITAVVDKKYFYNREDFITKFMNLEINDANGGRFSPIGNYVWNKLFPAHIFKTCKYPVGKKYEDINITLELFYKVDNFVVLPNALYNYFMRDDSIVHSPSKKSLLDFVAARLKQETELVGIDNCSKIARILTLTGCISVYANVARGYFKLTNSEDEYLRRIIIERKTDLSFKYKQIYLKYLLVMYFSPFFRILCKNIKFTDYLKG